MTPPRFTLTPTHQHFSLSPLPNTDFQYYLEGKIYPNTVETIQHLITSITSPNSSHFAPRTEKARLVSTPSIPHFSSLLYFQHPNSPDWYLLNDPLGRLPCYYYIDPSTGNYIFSREISEVLKLVAKVEFDPQALAEMLLLGYPLGDKTLYKNIYYLPPASMVRCINGKVKIETYHLWNFEEMATSGQQRSVEELVNLFLEGVKRRTVEKQVVALSGGLDSRVVAGALDRLGSPFDTATCLDVEQSAIKDVKAAKEMAHLLGVNWEKMQLPEASPADIEQLIQLKAGHNYLGMAFILPFLRKLQAKGYQQYWTGDGGDKVLPDISPLRKVKSSQETLRYLLDRQALMPIAQVAQLTRLNEKTIREGIINQLETYPEKQWNYKYIHFQLLERGHKWIGEGEDRNRYFMWSVSPFYDLAFFEAAMEYPISEKKGFKLYRQFLQTLHPQLANYPNANWDFPITDEQQLKRLLLRQQLGTYVPGTWKAWRKKYNALHADKKGKWRAMIKRSMVTHQTLDLESLWQMPQLSVDNLYYIWTVIRLEDLTIND